MLGVAGTIEGFVSTGTGGLTYRMALGGASVLFLLLYLRNGASYLHSGAAPPVAGGQARTRPA
jgi:hypothetical protein